MSAEATLAFVGDSLTADGRWSEWFPDATVLNLGSAGDTSDDLLARLDAVVAAGPDLVALLIGTNDLAWGRTVEHVVRNVESILVELRRRLPGARIVVQSVLPRERGYAQRIHAVNRHVRQFAATVHADYLDLWPALALAGGELNPAYTDDGLALNDTGYEAWRAELEPALATASRPPGAAAR